MVKLRVSSPVLDCCRHCSFSLANLLSRELVFYDSQWARLQNIDHCFSFFLKLPVLKKKKNKGLAFQHKHTKRRCSMVQSHGVLMLNPFQLSHQKNGFPPICKALVKLRVLIEAKKTLHLEEIEYPYPSR